MEFQGDYDCKINYQPRKANVVLDALSKKVQMARLMLREWELLEKASKWIPKLTRKRIICGNFYTLPSLLTRIKKAQKQDPT